MFIKITTPVNPLRIENTLRPYKRGEKPFSPKVAKQILSMTNHKKNIYDMLQLIAALSKDEQIKYKKIVLSTFDHREQPTDTIILAKKLAIANGYEDELNQTIKHDPMTANGVIYASAFHEIVVYICADEKPDLSQYIENATFYCVNNEVDLCCADLSLVKALRFKEESKVNLWKCQNLPADLDVSMCAEVDLSRTDLSPIKNLRFKEESKVNLWKCQNLPADLDVSMCAEVDLSGTDLSLVKALRFKEESKVNLWKCQNLPTDLDVSMCARVDLSKTNLSNVKKLKFKNKAQKEESKVIIPEDWQGKIIYTNEQPMNKAYLNKDLSR